MTKKEMGIVRAETREEQIISTRNQLVRSLKEGGFSYGEIEQIIRIDKGGASRVVRFGKNISKHVTAD